MEVKVRVAKCQVWVPTAKFEVNCGECCNESKANYSTMLRGILHKIKKYFIFFAKCLFKQIQCDGVGKKICQTNGIQGYPTLKLYHKGKVLDEYYGERKAGNVEETEYHFKYSQKFAWKFCSYC